MLGIPERTSERKRTASGCQQRCARDGDQGSDDSVCDAAAGLAHGHGQLRQKRGIDRFRAGVRNVCQDHDQDDRADHRAQPGNGCADPTRDVAGCERSIHERVLKTTHSNKRAMPFTIKLTIKSKRPSSISALMYTSPLASVNSLAITLA